MVFKSASLATGTGGGTGGGVVSLQGLTGALNLTSTGNTITITPSGTNIDIEAITGGSGTVTSVSGVTANGFAFSITNPTINPAITAETTVTGILRGNATAISAVSVGANLSFSGGGLVATPSGISGNLQYNNNGAFGADTASTDGAGHLTVSSVAVTGGTAPNDGIYLAGGSTVAITSISKAVAEFNNPVSAVDFFQFQGAATANPATLNINAAGTDTNISINAVPKGSGTLQQGGIPVALSTASITVSGVSGVTGGGNVTLGSSITLGMADSIANTIAGYNSSGVFSDVSIGSNLSLVGGILNATGTGGGVTSFSGDGALINNSLSTGAVITTLSSAPSNSVWGNNAPTVAAPSYITSINIAGNIISGFHDIYSNSANALVVSQSSSAYPAFNIDASTVGSSTGLDIVSRVAGSGISLIATSSGANEGLSITSKGAGTVSLTSNSGTTVQVGSNLGTGAGSQIYINRGNTALSTLCEVTFTADVTTGNQNSLLLGSETLQGGTAGFRALWIAPFLSTVGSGNYSLIDAGTSTALGGTGSYTQKFRVDTSGNVLSIGRLTSNSTTEIAAGLAMGAVGFSTTTNYGTNGFGLQINPVNYTSTTASGNIPITGTNTFGTPTLAATSGTTLGAASNIYISSAPAAGSNVTIINPYALYINSGATYFGGNIDLTSGLIDSTGSLGQNNYVLTSNGSVTQWSAISGPVSSVFGRTGAVVADWNDYQFNLIGGTASVSQGGTGLQTLTANAVLLGEGISNVSFATTGIAARILVDQGSGVNPAFETISGDVSLISTGATTVLAVHGVTYPSSPSINTIPAILSSNTAIYTTALPNGITATTQAASDNSTLIATDQYVTTAIANAIAGVNPAVAVQAATIQASDTSSLTYNNGVSGVGATFTGATNTALTIDGYTFTALGQRLLIKNDTQSANPGAYNGIYYVTQLQTGILPPILTRALDYDQPSDINNTGAIPVVNGTLNGGTSWYLTSSVTTVGTNPLTYAQFTLNPSTIITSSTTAGGSLSGTYPNPTIAVGAISGGTSISISNSGSVTGITYTGTASGVSTITNSDGSLTISPQTGVVVATLNSSHSNTWTNTQTYSAAVVQTPVALVITASVITTNASLGNYFYVPLVAGTSTLTNPTNAADSQVITYELQQPSSGTGALIAVGSAFDYGSSGAPSLSSAGSKIDLLGFRYSGRNSKWNYLGSQLGF